ncbi:MAG: DUF1080 domain-containing protein [Gemmataceae bacterium]
MDTKATRTLLGLSALSVLFFVGSTNAQEKMEKGYTSLFNGKNFDGWKTILRSKDADPSKTFMVKDGMIVVSGRPAGYFYTEKSYKNYVLKFDWKFSKPGNSGLLVHITGDHRIWPKCVEMQGQFNNHGHIFAISGAKGKFKTDRKALKKAIADGVDKWRTTTLVARNGMLTSFIDGVKISEGVGNVMSGPFGFQSEGTELYFKNIRIKEIPDYEPPTSKGFVQLFNGKNLDGWKFYLRTKEEVDPKKTFVVKAGQLQVTGFPFGYFYTDKSYKNYVLRYTWKYPKKQPKDTTMNSGCLVHMQPPQKIWPYSVEPQCRYFDHGKFFFIGFNNRPKQTFNFITQRMALNPSYEWNYTEVVSKNGVVKVSINGIQVNMAKTQLTSGPIGFQSEGARIHFKDIIIKPMD